MSLQDHQVLQRGADSTARGLAVGGPYAIEGAQNILVGDLWVLAGQSNMEGVGDLVDVETPSPYVRSFQSREEWSVAEEPLHWLGESPRAVHHRLWGADGVPEGVPPRDPSRSKGAGLGLAFAKAYHAATGVPVGMIPSAHGGTSMDQWDPTRKAEGGASLYGATCARVAVNGGHVRGILWYQGESDCSPAGVEVYMAKMRRLIDAFRTDFGDPELPFYFVQLGVFACPASPDGIAGWNGIREQQRRLAATIPHTAMVSAIDLELDDLIHIGTSGLKRLGRRLAAVATGAPTLDLKSVEWADPIHLRVTFSGVRGGLHAPGRPAGFALRDAAGNPIDLLYKITLEGDAAILHITDGHGPIPQGMHLYYGWGLNPYCNITDAEDMAVPAFGPIGVPNQR
jgi:hypothetical protein